MVAWPHTCRAGTVVRMAQQIGDSRSKSVDHLLRVAIAQTRLVTFNLKGLTRRAEPHDYGITNGTARLFFYQVGGQSSSAAPFGWRWATVSEISDLEILDETFSGNTSDGIGPARALGSSHGLGVGSAERQRI